MTEAISNRNPAFFLSETLLYFDFHHPSLFIPPAQKKPPDVA